MNATSTHPNSGVTIGIDRVRDQPCADLVFQALTGHHISCDQISVQTQLNIVSYEDLVQNDTIVISDQKPKSGIWCRRSALSAKRDLPEEFLELSYHHIADQIGLFAAHHDLLGFIAKKPKEIGMARLMNWGYHQVADINLIKNKLKLDKFKYGLVLRSNDMSYDFGDGFDCRNISIDFCKITSFTFIIGAL